MHSITCLFPGPLTRPPCTPLRYIFLSKAFNQESMGSMVGIACGFPHIVPSMMATRAEWVTCPALSCPALPCPALPCPGGMPRRCRGRAGAQMEQSVLERQVELKQRLRLPQACSHLPPSTCRLARWCSLGVISHGVVTAPYALRRCEPSRAFEWSGTEF
jgi:hypothetical protein